MRDLCGGATCFMESLKILRMHVEIFDCNYHPCAIKLDETF